MISKAQIKYIQSLSRQKYRKEYQAYLVEGEKNANEWLLSSATIKYILAVEDWLKKNTELLQLHPNAEISELKDFELQKITQLTHAQQVVLVVEMPVSKTVDFSAQSWTLFLERVQDPGNMGTIIRTADWFGIDQVITSPGCVEIFNPKVVQASMGSILRVQVSEMETLQLINERPVDIPLYAAYLDGENVFDLKESQAPGIIAMGNESKGLSQELLANASRKFSIPRFGGAESLNVSVATGILCALLLK